MTLKTIAVAILASVLVASCGVHGQRGPKPVLPEVADRLHWKVFRSHSSHNAAFFKHLMFGRVFVYEQPRAPNIVQGAVFLKDGSRLQCFVRSDRGRNAGYALEGGKLSFETGSTGASRTIRHRREDAPFACLLRRGDGNAARGISRIAQGPAQTTVEVRSVRLGAGELAACSGGFMSDGGAGHWLGN